MASRLKREGRGANYKLISAIFAAALLSSAPRGRTARKTAPSTDTAGGEGMKACTKIVKGHEVLCRPPVTSLLQDVAGGSIDKPDGRGRGRTTFSLSSITCPAIMILRARTRVASRLFSWWPGTVLEPRSATGRTVPVAPAAPGSTAAYHRGQSLPRRRRQASLRSPIGRRSTASSISSPRRNPPDGYPQGGIPPVFDRRSGRQIIPADPHRRAAGSREKSRCHSVWEQDHPRCRGRGCLPALRCCAFSLRRGGT